MKVAAATAAGAFFGALQLDHVPATWADAKAVLAPALGAAIAAEFVFLRSQLAAFIASAIAVVLLSGCISSAPVVAQTPANQDQIATCQTLATEHNGFVVGGLVVGVVATPTIAAVAAGVTDTQAKTDLAIGAAVAGGLAVLSAGGAALTGASFANGNCSSVVGALPPTP